MKLQMLAMQECSPSTHFIRRHRRRRTYEDTHSLVHRKQQKNSVESSNYEEKLKTCNTAAFELSTTTALSVQHDDMRPGQTQSMSEQQSLMKNYE